MRKSFVGFLRLVVATSVLVALFTPMAVDALDMPQSAPTVCLDKDGQIKKGEIDVLVLLDNSGSLNGEKSATDPGGKRFEALDEFIDNFSQLGSSRKNFGLVSFANSASPIIKIGPLTTSNVNEVKEKIKTDIGDPYGATNYIDAFKVANNEFRLKDPKNLNCKILIWFTDGGFQIQSKNTDDEISLLENEFCSDDGFVKDVQENDINTFVVFLGTGTSSDDDTQKRMDVSIDAMQVITGDQTPSIQEGINRIPKSVKCGDRFTIDTRHLGEVVSASEAKDLIGYLTDIVNIADGGKSVSKEDCPIQSGTLESLPMPSGWFIDWVSVTSWDGDLPSADLLKLEVNFDGSNKLFSDYFDPIDSQKSRKVLRFAIKEGKQGDLKPGWIIQSKELGRACLRAKPVDVKFRISGNQRIPINPSLPEEFFAGNNLRCFLNANETPCSSTSGDGLIGKISLEHGKMFSVDETLPVSIEISELPSLTNDRCAIELVGDYQPSKERLTSTVCGVVPAPAMSVRVHATDLLNGLQECGLGPWHITVDGVDTDQIQSGANKVLIGLESDAAPENKNVKCVIDNSYLTFEFATPTGANMPQIMSVVGFNLKKRTDLGIAILLATIATAIVSLLSLLLLRAVNMLTSKTVRAQDLFGYETSLDLVPGQFQRGELVFSGGSTRSFTADIDQLQQVSGNHNQTLLKFASINLVRELPSFFKPFDESRLVLQSKARSVFWKANRAGDGLNMAFSKAVILSTIGSQPPTNDRPAKVLISVLVPKRGYGAGIEGVQQLVHERGEELAAALFSQMQSVQKDPSNKDVRSKSVIDEPVNPITNEREAPSAPAVEPMDRPTNPLAGQIIPPQPPQPPRRNI